MVLPLKENGEDDSEGNSYYGRGKSYTSRKVISINSNYLIVSAYNKDDTYNNNSYSGVGIVYLYKKNIDDTWGIFKKINLIDYINQITPFIANAMYFGSTVKLLNNYILVGAEGKCTFSTNDYSGAAYLFKFDSTDIVLLKELKESDFDTFNSIDTSSRHNNFGYDVDIKQHNNYDYYTITISADQFDNSSDSKGDIGCIFIYELMGDSVTPISLIPSIKNVTDEEFGLCVSIDKFIAVGSEDYIDNNNVKYDRMGMVTLLQAPNMTNKRISSYPIFDSRIEPYEVIFDEITDKLTFNSTLKETGIVE